MKTRELPDKIILGDKCVFLGPDSPDGVKIITAYASKEKAASFKSRKAIENDNSLSIQFRGSDL